MSYLINGNLLLFVFLKLYIIQVHNYNKLYRRCRAVLMRRALIPYIAAMILYLSH